MTSPSQHGRKVVEYSGTKGRWRTSLKLRSLSHRLLILIARYRRVVVLVSMALLVTHIVLQRRPKLRPDWRVGFYPNASAYPMPQLQLDDLTSPGYPYTMAPMESYIFTHAQRLGLAPAVPSDARTVPYVNGCDMWDAKKTTDTGDRDHLVEAMQQYQKELRSYTATIDQHPPVKDLRRQLRDTNWTNVDAICEQVTLHPETLFPSGQYSHLPRSGFLEPLYPPFRHYPFCTDPKPNLLNLDYLVHDFGALCRQLQPHSRIVLLDIGASLSFHVADGSPKSPALFLDHLYRSMGLPFDHIYGFEVTPQNPVDVYHAYLPREWLSAYHWINVGVAAAPDAKMNPWNWIRDTCTKDDIVIVKLDIDTPDVELPLVLQLLNDTALQDRIDHLYFEHHVALEDIAPWWKRRVSGTVMDSMHLFASLRAKGIAAHFWV